MVSISVSEVVGITFFSEIGTLECMYFWWYRTSFIWWSMWLFFFGMVPLVSVLLSLASASNFWERLRGMMLYSMEAISWWSSYTSTCGWQLRCIGIFWKSSKNWSMTLSLPLSYFSRFSAWVLLFSYNISFSHFFFKSS